MTPCSGSRFLKALPAVTLAVICLALPAHADEDARTELRRLAETAGAAVVAGCLEG